MATYEQSPRFRRDWERLSDEFKEAFRSSVATLSAQAPGPYSKGLRVKAVQGSTRGIYEMTFLGDGRATFEYGEPLFDGVPHVVWRRIGTHSIFREP